MTRKKLTNIYSKIPTRFKTCKLKGKNCQIGGKKYVAAIYCLQEMNFILFFIGV